jgi:hypothetical protein
MAKKTAKPAAKPDRRVSRRKTAMAVSHDVFFSLNDNSPQARKRFIALGKRYLTDHPGTLWFTMGPLAEEMKREVNDRGFDVALHLVFKNKAALDQYAVSERHQTFIKHTRASWKSVRVFDSYVEA